MNRNKIMALLLTTFLVSNMTTNFVSADINDNNYKSQYAQMFQSEPIVENPISKSEIIATATSAQGGEDASKAIDGNTSTLWHTPWAGVDVTNNPQSLTLNFGKTRNISSIHVTPRQQGNNGIIKDYKIYAGDTVIAEGTWKTDASTKYISLPEPISTDNIRIEAISSVGDTSNKYVSIAEVDVYEVRETPTKLASTDNLVISAGAGGNLTDQLDSVKNLEEGTAIIRFTASGSGVQSLFSISNSSRANEHFHVYVNGGKVGYELRKQSGNVSTGVVSKALNTGINTIAFRAQKNGGYSIYLNGDQILNNNVASANFLQALEGADTFKLGTTDRVSGENEYNFTGKIDYFEMYDKPLADRYLKEITGQTKAADLPLPEGTIKTEAMDLFAPGELGSNNFRIPALYTTKNGTVLASIDVRKGGGHDAPNNIDTGIKRSTDGGVTWDEGKIILDYPGSSSAIDTAMVQNEETGRIFLIVTHFAEGYGFLNSVTGSGYKEVDGVRYLKLLGASGEEYTVRENGVVYDSNNTATDYTVDEDKNLFQNGTKVGNVLLSNSPLKVMGTAFISMVYSDDDGVTWSKPIDLNKQAKAEWMRFFGTGPGRGHQVKNGEYAGRLIFPIYVTNASGFQSSAVIYSDDNGETWEMGETATDGRPMADGTPASAETITTSTSGGVGQLTECQVVEMPNGQLKMFMRNTGGNSGRVRVATSFDGGATWDNDVIRDEVLVEPYCQMSVINYSKKIDGKDALIFSNPNAGNRSNGTVRIGLITENGIHINGETKYDIEWKYSNVVAPGTFAYSCLSEMPNGEIGLFYEGTDSQEMSFTRMNVEYLKADLLADAPSAKIKSITSLDEDLNYLPGDTANLKVTFDQTVSLFGDRNLTLIVDGKEVTGALTKISGTEYKITATLPQDITEGTHSISIKAKTGLEIVNVIGKVVNMSEDIPTDSTLVIESTVVGVDKTELQQEVDSCQGLSEEIYTKTSWDVFKIALDEAKVVLAAENVTQQDVDVAKTSLINAKNQLVEINKIFEYYNFRIENGSENGNISLVADDVKNLEEGTIVMRFDNKGGDAFQTLLSFSNNTQDKERFYLYITGDNRIGFERQSTDGNKSYYATNLTLNAGINTIALKVEKNVGYSIFVNGVKALTQADTSAKFIKGITGLNSVNIGRSDRLSSSENPLTGDVDFIQLYGSVMVDEELIAVTEETKADPEADVPIIESVIVNGSEEEFNVGDEIVVNVKMDQVVSMIGTKTLTLLVDGVEIPVEFLKQVDGKNFSFKGTIPSGISAGEHTISIKAMTNLDIVNVNGVKVDLSNDIATSTKIAIAGEVVDQVDKSILQALVTECLALNEADYTAESWILFVEALRNARAVLANGEATQVQVDLALEQLQAAKDGLVEKEEVIEVFKRHLEITVEVAQEITDFTDVVPAVKAEFDVALAEAIALLADENATQEQVNKSFDRLSKAIHMLEFKGNKEMLINLLTQIESLNSKNYTKESWDTLQAVINREDIQEVINDENALQADIEKAYNDIFTAFSRLVEVSEQVNKDRLNNLITKVENLNANEYIDTTWKNLFNALSKAKVISADANATQTEVDEAYENLLRTYLELRLKPSKDKLEDLINKAESLDANKYTDKSYKAVEKALKAAKKVFADDKATTEEIAKAEKNLEVAMANLQLKDQGTGNNGGNSDNSGKLPQTGGTSVAAFGLFGVISTTLGAVMFRKKRK